MEFLEIPLYDDDLVKLLVRFAVNLIFLSLVVFFAIYPTQRERDFAFTAVMLNVTVFFICFTLKKLEIDIGMALGLFAIFGVLRYRTDAICTKEMTYLFIVIGIAVINSLSNKKTSYAEIGTVNMLIFAAAMLKEWIVGRMPPKPTANGNEAKVKTVAADAPSAAKATKYTIEYDHPDRLGETQRDELLKDLRERTGLDIARVQIKSIDLQQNVATLNVWSSPPSV